jgi:hypothetical protein
MNCRPEEATTMTKTLLGCSDSLPTHIDITTLNAALLMLVATFVLAFALLITCRMLPSVQKPYIRARKSRVLSDPAEMM